MNKWVLIAIVLTLLSAYFTVYSYEAYMMADSKIIEWNGGIWWRTTPSGSLFPWPKESGMLQALSKVNEADLFIYTCLIKSSVLVILLAIMWIFSGLSMFKLYKQLKNSH